MNRPPPALQTFLRELLRAESRYTNGDDGRFSEERLEVPRVMIQIVEDPARAHLVDLNDPCNEKFQRSLSSLVGVFNSEESSGSSDDLRWNPSGESSTSLSSSPVRKKETTSRQQKISLLLSPRPPTRQDSNKSLGETNTAKLLEEEGVKKHSNTFLLREPEDSLCSLLQLSRRNRLTGEDEVGSDPFPVPDRARHQRISDICCDLLDD